MGRHLRLTQELLIALLDHDGLLHFKGCSVKLRAHVHRRYVSYYYFARRKLLGALTTVRVCDSLLRLQQ